MAGRIHGGGGGGPMIDAIESGGRREEHVMSVIDWRWHAAGEGQRSAQNDDACPGTHTASGRLRCHARKDARHTRSYGVEM